VTVSKAPKALQIVHLYPKEMNIYGDTGNRIVLEKRLAWRNIPYTSHLVGIGDPIPKDADIIIGGGGQDASQGAVEQDLVTKKDALKDLARDGAVMLMVCGMYQLLGRRFLTGDGREIKGLAILPVETLGRSGRLIGNIVVDVPGVGKVVGYENHSGRTYLDDDASSMAKVLSGSGNDDTSGMEGCRMNNVFATYMHGPVLSKNPKFADLLISLALERKGMDSVLSPLDDTLENKAKKVASSRPR
jgi:lipid II isoglutaminyl synthase (glutamine-hydrolysing)